MKPPPFKKVAKPKPVNTPLDLFAFLPRKKSHAYLRAEQNEVLRAYAEVAGATDVAMELPTGTGKTCVGLLVAEWWRRKGHRAAYLCLTNQLVAQALEESKELGIPTADLHGNKHERSHTGEQRFAAAEAVAVTNYANLFNTNPVIDECGVLVLDDAHGAEQRVAQMWTICVTRREDDAKFAELTAALRPAMSGRQLGELTDSEAYDCVELVDVLGHPECLPAVRAALQSHQPSRFAWQLLSPKLREILFLASPHEITIRPLIPPTFSHKPFSGAKQRIYMSATLGSAADLQRAYAITSLKEVRATSPQSGRRYVFVPGLVGSEEVADKAVVEIWNGLNPRRALLLAPSQVAADAAFNRLAQRMNPQPARMGHQEVESDLAPFTTADNAMLVLAGRYDGLDLPDDDCRLLILAGGATGTDALERHLVSRWCMGPVMRSKELMRLVQGMGRCTRGATDFAVVVWLGDSLTKAANSNAIRTLPPEIRRELEWGKVQFGMGGNLASFVAMATELLRSPAYRAQANEAISEAEFTSAGADEAPASAPDEVRFSKALWEGDYQRALDFAREITDGAGKWDGYRAWWWYMAGTAANLAGDKAGEIDCLQKSRKCGVGTGFTSHLLKLRNADGPACEATSTQAEAIWKQLEVWGWSGAKFRTKLDEMKGWLASARPGDFHRGLARLGEALGARAEQLTEEGCPDCVWYFYAEFFACFEAKTEKTKGSSLSKKELQEAKGHPQWVDSRHPELKSTDRLVVIVSPAAAVHEIGKPFVLDLHVLLTHEVRSLAAEVDRMLSALRTKFASREYAEAHTEFAAEVRAAGLDLDSVEKKLSQRPLGQ